MEDGVMRILLVIAISVLLSGCAAFVDSFKTQPGQMVPTLPVREHVIGSNVYVSVRIMDGGFRPICLLPDAANEISCVFYYEYLEHGISLNPNGYLFLGYDSARGACSEAIWSLGGQGGLEILQACTRALLQHRWIVDHEYGKEEPR
jgi:hypothetical protein